MKPIALFQFSSTEGPGYFATFLSVRRVPWRLIRIDEGDSVPPAADSFSAIGLMGGPMSVNDDFPWIAQVSALLRAAMNDDIPIIGHCLGGQLLARALGAEVSKAPVVEIGWGEVQAVDPAAQAWLGDSQRFLSFHWHNETFAIPAGATRILSSRHCANQAYVIGPHLGMQCHVEMTRELVELWCETGAVEIARAQGAGVQDVGTTLNDLDARVTALHRYADRIYSHWLGRVQR